MWGWGSGADAARPPACSPVACPSAPPASTTHTPAAAREAKVARLAHGAQGAGAPRLALHLASCGLALADAGAGALVKLDCGQQGCVRVVIGSVRRGSQRPRRTHLRQRPTSTTHPWPPRCPSSRLHLEQRVDAQVGTAHMRARQQARARSCSPVGHGTHCWPSALNCPALHGSHAVALATGADPGWHAAIVSDSGSGSSVAAGTNAVCPAVWGSHVAASA